LGRADAKPLASIDSKKSVSGNAFDLDFWPLISRISIKKSAFASCRRGVFLCKTRYRLLEIERLLEPLGLRNFDSFVREYRSRIEPAIAASKLQREGRWTEGIAVGSRAYVGKIAAAVRRESLRPRFEKGENGSWLVWWPIFIQPGKPIDARQPPAARSARIQRALPEIDSEVSLSLFHLVK